MAFNISNLCAQSSCLPWEQIDFKTLPSALDGETHFRLRLRADGGTSRQIGCDVFPQIHKYRRATVTLCVAAHVRPGTAEYGAQIPFPEACFAMVFCHQDKPIRQHDPFIHTMGHNQGGSSVFAGNTQEMLLHCPARNGV